MAKAAVLSVLLLALLMTPSAAAVGPHNGQPDPNADGVPDPAAFLSGMPWFGGGGGAAAAASAAAAAGGGGGGGGGGAFFGGGGAQGGGGGFFGGGGAQQGGGGGFFSGGGWGGAGEGGTFGYRRGAVVPPSTVCSEEGPCKGKHLTCPAHCFRSFSYQGAHGGGGGGGGGCSFDCTTRCAASC